MKEHLHPDTFAYKLDDPLPSPNQAIKLEQYRQKGCVVEYNQPRWITEEKSKSTDFSTYKDIVSVEDRVKLKGPSKKKKEVLAKTFSFRSK